MSRRKDIVRLLSDIELQDIRFLEDRDGTPYSDRDMLLDHIDLLSQRPIAADSEDRSVTGRTLAPSDPPS